ncbi:MAG: hypothetical protein ABL925_10440 [Methylococcales bacterium]
MNFSISPRSFSTLRTFLQNTRFYQYIVKKTRFFSLPIAAVLLGFAQTSGATILQFDQIRDAGGNVLATISGRDVETDYGDRVTGSPMNVTNGQFTYGNGGEGFTANVVTDFFAATALPNAAAVSLWQDSYGDLTNVLIGNNNSNTLNVQLSADSGFQVQLHHFDLAGWPNTDYTINAVRVLSNASTLFSQGNVVVEGNLTGARHTLFDFSTPLTATELLIQIDYSNLPGGQHDNIGIDNIRFGQTPPATIPLPTAWILFASGFAAIAFRKRSR